MSAPAAAPADVVPTAARRERMQPVSTPVGLWIGVTSVVMALLALGLVGLRSIDQRRSSVATVDDDATPMVVSAVELYVALAAADAAASTSFVRTGPESAELRARYIDEIGRAQQELATISQAPGLSGASEEALATIFDGLISYTGRIETARTNDRFNVPVGFAYQRSASQVMRDEMLPAATTIYRDAAGRLDRGLREGRAPEAEVLLIAVVIVALLTLIGVHVFVTRRTRRWLNIGLIAAVVVVLAVTVWLASGLASQRNTFGRAQLDGSEPLLVHSVARILALQSLSDENLDLILSGTDPAPMADFETMVERMGGRDGRSGLLAQAREAAGDDPDARARVEGIVARYVDYLAAHDRVRAAADRYDYPAAIELAVGEQAAASDALDAALTAEIDRVRGELERGGEEAFDRLRWMPPVLVMATVMAGAAALAGLWPRLREYR